jgi:hypothetical protein
VSHPDDLIAVLDANVLYLQWLRDVMLTLAAMGLQSGVEFRHVHGSGRASA